MIIAPDSQPGDAYGWVANQAGHAAIVGVGLAGLLIWLPPVMAALFATAAYFFVWELAYQIVKLGSKLYRDAVADTINVGFGAAMAAAIGPEPIFWGLWVGWVVVLLIGAGFRR